MVSLFVHAPSQGSAAGGPLVATGGGGAAGRWAGAAALGADGGQLAAAEQAQRLAEAEGQAVPLAAWGAGRLGLRLAALLPCAGCS